MPDILQALVLWVTAGEISEPAAKADEYSSREHSCREDLLLLDRGHSPTQRIDFQAREIQISSMDTIMTPDHM